MRAEELVRRCREIAVQGKTVYMMGTFGMPLTEALIRQKALQYPNFYPQYRKKFLQEKAGAGLWAFDCVGLIKGILWGWEGDPDRTFGGAKYKSNQVPDVSANGMTALCEEKSGDFSGILPGEAVYMDGHIGVYLGNGTVAEATLTDRYDGVALTDLSERSWKGHGKLPWVEYERKEEGKPAPRERKVGDVVSFRGGKHYVSSTGSVGFAARPGKAKITHLRPGAKHPYHLIHTDRTSNVYGCVDEDTVE